MRRRPSTVNCRNCPKKTRERCIRESNTSTSIKLMMRSAFETGTDTQQVWGLLQMNCLLLHQTGRGRPVRPPAPTRLPEDKPKAARRIKKEAILPSLPVVPAAAREPTRPPSPAPRREIKQVGIPLSRYCLTLQDSQHRIALPTGGEIVLGRFDSMVKTNPDVDLSYDDRDILVISRRHARIVGRDGLLEIEDLGSTNGTRVNGRKLALGQKVQLQPGDRVTLGYHDFSCSPMPVAKTSPYAPRLAYLWGTFTGHRFPLPPLGEVIIGRRDLVAGIIPDIDLSQEGVV
ncbi:MAG: FHA domain-containing protein, partial [Chloroflexi bacterium]|nr:FHA domain-containing protein [Chloroflexota bacterium]